MYFNNLLLAGEAEGWAADTDVLFYGRYEDIVDGQMPNRMPHATGHLTVAGAAGSETYICPNNATYRVADNEYFWIKADEVSRTVTTAELIGYDLDHTIVKYDSATPHAIESILIFNDGATLTTQEENELRDDFLLSMWWDDELSLYGELKDNRDSEQNVWVPDQIPPDANVSNLVITNKGGNVQVLSLTMNSTDEDGVSWEQSLDGATGWVEVADTGAGVATATIIGLDHDTKYFYRARNYRTFGAYQFYGSYCSTANMYSNNVINSFDWEAPYDAYGIANGWKRVGAYDVVATIVTGNGFTGDAIRVVEDNVGDLATISPLGTYGIGGLTVGETYAYSFKYRASHTFYWNKASGVTISSWAPNTGDAIAVSGTYVPTDVYWYIGCLYVAGCWCEIDEFLIYRTS